MNKRIPLGLMFLSVLLVNFSRLCLGLDRKEKNAPEKRTNVVIPKEGTNITLDYGFGKGTPGFYIQADEAF